MDSYSTFTVHYGTQQKYDAPIERAKQRIDIPSSWCGAKPGHGSYRTAIRTVHVMGTVEVSYYGTRCVEYGKCAFNGMVVVVVQDGTSWRAVEKKEVKGCIA